MFMSGDASLLIFGWRSTSTSGCPVVEIVDTFLFPSIQTRIEITTTKMMMIVPIAPTTAPKSSAPAEKLLTLVSVHVDIKLPACIWVIIIPPLLSVHAVHGWTLQTRAYMHAWIHVHLLSDCWDHDIYNINSRMFWNCWQCGFQDLKQCPIM